MSTTYKDYKKDLEKALSLISRTKDEEIQAMAAMMNWETRIAQDHIACLREKLLK